MRGNIKNLIPNSKRTPEELHKMTSNGGKKSVKIRRIKKSTREIIEAIFDSKAPKNYLKKLQKKFPDLKIKTIEELINTSMVERILKGNVQAYNALYDRKEGKPSQKVDIDSKNLNLNKELSDEEHEKALSAIKRSILVEGVQE